MIFRSFEISTLNVKQIIYGLLIVKMNSILIVEIDESHLFKSNHY